MLPESHTHIAARYCERSGSPFQCDRAFLQRRRRAERLSLWMAARWLAIGAVAVLVASRVPF